MYVCIHVCIYASKVRGFSSVVCEICQVVFVCLFYRGNDTAADKSKLVERDT